MFWIHSNVLSFYPYFYDKCILVESNPFYPYTLKIVKNTKYKINKYEGDTYKEYPNIWNATFTTVGKTTLENVEFPNIVISISSWRLSIYLAPSWDGSVKFLYNSSFMFPPLRLMRRVLRAPPLRIVLRPFFRYIRVLAIIIYKYII